jgi:uncharacterized protein (TIGR02466 family)
MTGVGNMNKFLVQGIFPTPIITSETNYKFSQAELDFIQEFKQKTYQNISNITSQENYILQCPEMKTIAEFIQEGIDCYVQNIIDPAESLDFYVTQSWLNFTEPNQYHHEHDHPNSLISGVMYINADPEQDKLHFTNNKYERISITPRNYNHFNTVGWVIPVDTGKVVLFDSRLKHAVESTTSTDTRISLAFNVFARGLFGNEKSLTALNLK